MRTVTYRLADLKNLTINLGFVGENEHTVFRFDCMKAFEEYPDAVPSLAVTPPNGDPYPAVTIRDGDYVEWTINDSDVAQKGNGEAQLTFIQDNVVMKDYIFRTKIERSILPTGEAPDPIQDWIDEANEALGTISGAVEDAEEARDAAIKAKNDAVEAQGKAETAQGKAEDAQGYAESAQTAAETAQGLAEGARDSAQGYASDAESARDLSARWATGGTSGTPGSTNNSKYYAEQASGKASEAAQSASDANGYATTASNKAGEASQSASDASGYATTASNKAVDAADSASAAAGSATTASNKAGEASNSATSASGSATSANADALKAEGYAVGKQNGTDVSSSSPYYHKNAKYYADSAAQSAEDAQDVLDSIPQDYTQLSNNVSNLKSAFENTKDKTIFDDRYNEIVAGSNGHLQPLPYILAGNMPYWMDSSGSSTITDNIEPTTDKYPFTDYIKCSKKLIISVKDSTTRIVIYFYVKTDENYVLNWSVIKTNTGSGIRNYIGRTECKYVYDLPDNCYIRYSIPVGSADIFTWDGKFCGIKTASGIDYLASNGEIAVSTSNNRFTTVVPSNTLFVFSDETLFVYIIMGIKPNGQITILNTEYGLISYVFPKNTEYQSYMISLERRDPTHPSDTVKNIYNDLSGHLYVITSEFSVENVVADAKKLMKNAEKVNQLEWTPKADLLLRQINETELKYKTGITYHGLPYGTRWDEPHLIGWHISPHTFTNAVNDENSVLYKEVVESSEFVKAPYYGTVCSAYVTMISGFPVPNTNAGFFYNPDILNEYDDSAPLGKIWSDGGHCVIPVQKLYSDDFNIVRIAESLKPLSEITTRYGNISVEKNAFSHYNGETYFDDTFYTARHKYQTFALSTVPYADFDDVTIVNGSARPYKGDKSVYTSAEETVKINLVGSGITKIILRKPSDAEVEIAVSASTVDIKSYLDEYGIYHVSTNIDETEEAFEYVNAVPITATITDRNITFSRNDFWYALVNVQGHWKLSRTGEIACVECRSNGDYSDWVREGMGIDDCYAVFYKGVYGAYIVPLTVNS